MCKNGSNKIEEAKLEKLRLEELAKVEAKKKELMLEIQNDEWNEVDKETASEKKYKPVENAGGR